MYGQATKKPVKIDYFVWQHGGLSELNDWVKSFGDNLDDHFVGFLSGKTALEVKTLEGTSYNVPVGYIIIRGIRGEYYPCCPDIFDKTYNRL
jgi:hypothetical protein